jgi:hypothetical protein
MIVDLNDTKNLDMAETDYEFRKLKSNKLMTEINKKKQEQNFMIIPMSIYNILETNSSFVYPTNDSFLTTNKDEELLRFVGSIYHIDVYLDILAPPDSITLSYDKSIMRDNKIDAILNNEELKEEIEITVLNY